MPLNTISIAANVAPVVVKTFWKNLHGKASRVRSSDQSEHVKDDVMYEEAYNIVKKFLELSTCYSVESLQTYTNTHVLSPPWSAVSPVLVPLSSCDKAAEKLIEWFDPDELKQVVGGERWWQVRGLDGLEAEWVTEKKFMLPVEIDKVQSVKHNAQLERDLTGDEMEILGMEHLNKVMLYIHGGGYFFGSINTHRYQILRYARKIKGRAFTVNYRKAPQYPWPCALQDVLAAYFYLIDPPRTAVHSPIDPGKIVFAGDSAGGGLCLSALTVIRDLGLPMPAGAVLISPWVDLTHSFPSVMDNIEKDIIPTHGFVYKPSIIWPADPLPERDGRMIPTESYPPPRPGHADTLKPSNGRVAADSASEQSAHEGISQREMFLSVPNEPCKEASPPDDEGMQRLKEKWVPKPPKVLMEDPSATPLELRSQIQMYATNEQLTHPLVSPIAQGSLGNLCPLFIIAGDEEALRDEVLYLAHRAANPEKYRPARSTLVDMKRQRENFECFRTPTKVHLQVYDGMSHVLTVYTFYKSVKRAYRSIANFVEDVTSNQFDVCKKPESCTAYSSSSSTNSSNPSSRSPTLMNEASVGENRGKIPTKDPGSFTKAAARLPGISSLFTESPCSSRVEVNQKNSINGATVAEQSDQSQPIGENLSEHPNMIRQRVDCRGKARKMEPEESIPCLQLPENEVCLLKEAPARLWCDQQKKWDKRFEVTAKRILRRRRNYEKKYDAAVRRALELGMIATKVEEMGKSPNSTGQETMQVKFAIDSDTNERRWNPLDLDDEHPPPSAIAGRRDNPDSLALLLSAIDQHPSKATKLKRAKPRPRQSTSEEQHYVHVLPIHGLKIWTVLMSYFGHKASDVNRKAKRSKTNSHGQSTALGSKEEDRHFA